MKIGEYSHWVDGPEDKGETSDGSEESLGLSILAGSSTSAVDDELVDNDEVSNAGPCVPAPLLTITGAVGSEETSQDHDDIGNNGNEDVGTSKTSEKSKIEQKKWGGNTPVDISGPVDLSVGNLFSVWETVLVADSLDDLVVVDTITGGHGEV